MLSKNGHKQTKKDNYRWVIPLGLALVGLTAVIVGLTLASKEENSEGVDHDVENYDVKGQPFIYGIAE
jgi:hypothetical protein